MAGIAKEFYTTAQYPKIFLQVCNHALKEILEKAYSKLDDSNSGGIFIMDYVLKKDIDIYKGVNKKMCKEVDYVNPQFLHYFMLLSNVCEFDCEITPMKELKLERQNMLKYSDLEAHLKSFDLDQLGKRVFNLLEECGTKLNFKFDLVQKECEDMLKKEKLFIKKYEDHEKSENEQSICRSTTKKILMEKYASLSISCPFDYPVKNPRAFFVECQDKVTKEWEVLNKDFDFLLTKKNHILLGGSCTGKTSFVVKLLQMWRNGENYFDFDLVVLIHPMICDDKEITLKDYIFKKLLNMNDSASVLDIQSMNVLYILDSFHDRIIKDKYKFVDDLFGNRYLNTKILISCDKKKEKELKERLDHYEILARFATIRINNFLSNKFDLKKYFEQNTFFIGNLTKINELTLNTCKSSINYLKCFDNPCILLLLMNFIIQNDKDPDELVTLKDFHVYCYDKLPQSMLMDMNINSSTNMFKNIFSLLTEIAFNNLSSESLIISTEQVKLLLGKGDSSSKCVLKTLISEIDFSGISSEKCWSFINQDQLHYFASIHLCSKLCNGNEKLLCDKKIADYLPFVFVNLTSLERKTINCLLDHLCIKDYHSIRQICHEAQRDYNLISGIRKKVYKKWELNEDNLIDALFSYLLLYPVVSVGSILISLKNLKSFSESYFCDSQKVLKGISRYFDKESETPNDSSKIDFKLRIPSLDKSCYKVSKLSEEVLKLSPSKIKLLVFSGYLSEELCCNLEKHPDLNEINIRINSSPTLFALTKLSISKIEDKSLHLVFDMNDICNELGFECLGSMENWSKLVITIENLTNINVIDSAVILKNLIPNIEKDSDIEVNTFIELIKSDLSFEDAKVILDFLEDKIVVNKFIVESSVSLKLEERNALKFCKPCFVEWKVVPKKKICQINKF